MPRKLRSLNKKFYEKYKQSEGKVTSAKDLLLFWENILESDLLPFQQKILNPIPPYNLFSPNWQELHLHIACLYFVDRFESGEELWVFDLLKRITAQGCVRNKVIEEAKKIIISYKMGFFERQDKALFLLKIYPEQKEILIEIIKQFLGQKYFNIYNEGSPPKRRPINELVNLWSYELFELIMRSFSKPAPYGLKKRKSYKAEGLEILRSILEILKISSSGTGEGAGKRYIKFRKQQTIYMLQEVGLESN